MPKSGSVGGSGTLACGDSAEDAHAPLPSDWPKLVRQAL